MTRFSISKSFRPRLSDKDIEAAEKQLGVRLPADYKQFLLEHNGGEPEPKYFPMEGNSPDTHGILAWLFGIHSGGPANLVDVANESLGRMPSELLPVGMDPGGNLLCLAVSGPNNNKVYFWAMEEEADEDKGKTPSYDNVYFVANSFTSLLDSLTSSLESK